MLRISETFTSLQGEGLHMGLPCFFIRLAGCNLHCGYCDTLYARSGGRDVPERELVEAWRQSGVALVQITGGEPLIQPGVYSLMDMLLEAGARIILETNGSVLIDRVPSGVVKVVDIKTPGSGMEGSWNSSNLRYLAGYDQIKFVIASREDYLWACGKMRRHNLPAQVNVLISPAWGLVNPRSVAEWMVADRLEARFQLQLHKVLWGEKTGR